MKQSFTQESTLSVKQKCIHQYANGFINFFTTDINKQISIQMIILNKF